MKIPLKQITHVAGTALISLSSLLGTAIPALAAWDADRLAEVEATLDRAWGAVFQQAVEQPFAAPWVYDISGNWLYEHQEGNVPVSPCGQVNIAHYCLRDGNVYIDAVALAQLAQDFGDAAPVYVVAHEYGHAAQHRLGMLESQSVKRAELQADCFAGLMFAAMEQQGLLEADDLEEASTIAAAVGDHEYTSADHHGTPIERQAHFLSGYQDQYSCFVQ